MDFISNIIETIKYYFYSIYMYSTTIYNSNVTKENISSAVFKSMYFTSKFVFVCELSQEEHKEDLITRYLDSSHSINPHHCYGNILLHPKYEKYLVDANLYFQICNNMFSYHTLFGKELNIKRSNGDIEKGKILCNTPIIYWEEYKSLAINVEFGDFKKTIPFNSINNMDNGLVDLNKEYFDNNIIKIFIKKGHYMFEEEVTEYLKFMRPLLKDTGMKYKIIFL